MTHVRVMRLGSSSLAASLAEVIGVLDHGEGVVLVSDELIVPEAALSPLTRNERAATSLLTAADRKGNVRVRHHVVQSVQTSFHSVQAPSHVSVGALLISQRDAKKAASALRAARALLESGAFDIPQSEIAEFTCLALVRSGIPVRSVGIVDVPWTRSHDVIQREATAAAVKSVSDKRVAALQANRIDDGFYSTFVVRKVSKIFTRAALRLGLRPNAITVISFIIGLLAAFSFAGGSRGWLIVGALLLQLSLVIDCVDGEVARATSRFSAVGAWLDASTDRVKEYAAYAGLAAGAAREGLDAWWIAIVLIVLQTTRHMSDYNFAQLQRLREATVLPRALDDPSDGQVTGWSSAIEASTRLNRVQAVHWVKKVIHMPIGERWLVLSVVAVLFNGQVALAALLALASLAFVYTLAGRVTRTLTWKKSVAPDITGAPIIAAQLDDGPLLAWWKPALRSRWIWALPMVLRALEMGLIAAVSLIAFPELITVAFFYLFAVAFHHYDVLYRALAGAAPARWLTWVLGGWDGRSVVMVVASVVGLSVFTGTLGFGITWLVLWGGIVASVQWLRSARRVA